jgi:predicted TIM-barrel fold metal-dependent hydrolase
MPSKRKIVDAHHHLWDLNACDYPWLMKQGVTRFFGDPAPIQRNYLVDELRADAKAYDLAGSVHIQVGVAAGDEVKESQWLEAVATETGLPSALVAFCDLAAPDASRVLDQHARQSRTRGIRQIVGRSAEEDTKTGSDALLQNPVWLQNLGSLARRDWSFDLQMIPQQAARVARVLSRMPQLRVAICHCGSPWDQSADGFRAWREGLAALAQLPNVVCKISGLAMFDHNWTQESARPIIESCIELFGPSRCMFGSNFPVDKLHKTCDEIWMCFESVAQQYSKDEQEQLFSATAANFYRLTL